MIKFFDPAKGYLSIKGEIDEAIQRVLSMGDLVLREDVEVFEKNLAEFVGTKYAVALNSGTDAIVLALRASGIGVGNEVIVPAYTFKSTIGSILAVGATPVLVDIGEDWKLYRTEKTKAVIPVHIAGELSNWKFEESDNLVVIEDSAQSLGARI
jgi:dTDP-4-amino-4,6-dideoxygalactose transaminase